MGPEISTNIGSLLRAMEKMVMPAIDPTQSLAIEQAHFILLYLKMLDVQHDKIFHFRLQEIQEFHALATSLLRQAELSGIDLGAAAAATHQAIDAALPLIQLDLPSYDQLTDIARDLREATDGLTQILLQDSANPGDLAELLLRQAATESTRERSWVARLGLDPDSGNLPDIAKLLGPA